MSERFFTIRAENGGVSIPLQDFMEIVSALGELGIDVEVQPTGDETIKFKFKQSQTQ